MKKFEYICKLDLYGSYILTNAYIVYLEKINEFNGKIE